MILRVVGDGSAKKLFMSITCAAFFSAWELTVTVFENSEIYL